MKYSSYAEYVRETSLSLNEIRVRMQDEEAEAEWNRQRREEEDPYRSASGLVRYD
jgi:hypothetical protein